MGSWSHNYLVCFIYCYDCIVTVIYLLLIILMIKQIVVIVVVRTKAMFYYNQGAVLICEVNYLPGKVFKQNSSIFLHSEMSLP